MEAVGRVFNNWSVIQTATLKLVTTFSCHGEYQTGLCLCVRERHKSHSPVIKAARLETRECAGCIFLSLSLFCSLLTLLCPFSILSLQFISSYYQPKGKNWLFSLPFWYQTATQVSFCMSIISTYLSFTHWFPHSSLTRLTSFITLTLLNSHFYTLFSPSFPFFLCSFFSPSLLQSLQAKGLHGVAPCEGTIPL